jgi:hypothetical protein
VADKPPLPHEEVQRVLRQLKPLIDERRIVLVSGQAVSFWMRLLQPHSEDLTVKEPLTSKDIDFEGGPSGPPSRQTPFGPGEAGHDG